MKRTHSMGLWFGGVAAVLLALAVLIYFTDNRVGLTLRSYRRLSQAETMALSFTVDTSYRNLSFGLDGEVHLDVPGERSRMRVQLTDFFLPLAVEFYQEPSGRYMQNPLFPRRWIPLGEEQERAAALSLTYKDLLLRRQFRELVYLFYMERSVEEDKIILRDDDYFELSEVEEILARLTGRTLEEIQTLNLSRYEVSLVFGKSADLLEEVAVTGWFMQTNQEFSLAFTLGIEALDIPLDFIPTEFQ